METKGDEVHGKIRDAHEKFVLNLKREERDLLYHEDIPLLFRVIIYSILIYLVRLITIDLFVPSWFKHDLTMLKATGVTLSIIKNDIETKWYIIRNEDTEALSIFFYDQHVIRRAVQPLLNFVKENKTEAQKVEDPVKLTEKYKRAVINRYISASPAFKTLIRKAVKDNNTILMKDLFIRLAWMHFFPMYGENALSPELDILVEKVGQML